MQLIAKRSSSFPGVTPRFEVLQSGQRGNRMKPVTTTSEILDEMLPTLADEFEAGNPHGRTFEPLCLEEFEPLRECLADMIAEGWLTQRRPLKIYCLTPAGYRNFKPRIQALRALGKP